jgi:hypothetical protein
MKSKVSLFLALLIFGIINSCSKSPACWGDDENKGIIEKYYNVYDFPMCVEAYVSENEKLVIKSSSELLNITDSNCYNLPEAGYSSTSPDIDYNEYSLVGFWTTGQCETKFIREVIKNETDKIYTYKIKVKDCGSCKSERYDANLVLVPKIPDGFIVDFVLEDCD